MQFDPIAGRSSAIHQAQGGLAGERGFDNESLAGADRGAACTDDFASGRAGSALGIIGSDPVRDSVSALSR